MSALDDAFDGWLARRGIHLIPRQLEAARAFLAVSETTDFWLVGRGGGKTFVLDALDRFIDTPGYRQARKRVG